MNDDSAVWQPASAAAVLPLASAIMGISPAPCIFNQELALERVQGKVFYAQEIASMFLLDLPKTLEQIDAAVAEHDIAQIERLGHRLRGAAIIVSGEVLAAIAAQLEQAAAANASGDVLRLVDAMRLDAARLCSALERFCRENVPPDTAAGDSDKLV